jgi:hypothetical protein
MCQSMLICTLNIFYDPSVFDNVDGLELGHALCVPMLVPVPGEWSNHWGGNTESSPNNDRPSKDVLITHGVAQGGRNKPVLRPNTTREASNGWRTCGFSFCCLSGKFLVSSRWALQLNEVGVDYVEHFLLLWLFSQWHDSYQVEILT